MFKKDLLLTVKVAFWALVAQLVAWPLYEFMNITDFFPPSGPYLPFGQAIYVVVWGIFVLGSALSGALVTWELLIGLKIKSHYWTVYILAMMVVVCWIITLTFHPLPAYHK